jgi:hypothetical protein
MPRGPVACVDAAATVMPSRSAHSASHRARPPAQRGTSRLRGWGLLVLLSTATAQKVLLGGASEFALLAKQTISGPGSDITGTVGVTGVTPASSYIALATMTADASGQFSTSTQVTGVCYTRSTDAAPTPALMAGAEVDMDTAYTDAWSRTYPTANLDVGSGAIVGHTFTPGVYRYPSYLAIAAPGFSLSGNEGSLFIFQVVGYLSTAVGVTVNMVDDGTGSGPPIANNVVWAIGNHVVFGAGSHFEGTLLVNAYITFGLGASLNGRALAQVINPCPKRKRKRKLTPSPTPIQKSRRT